MNKKIVILAPYPFNEAPSQRFRFEQYLPYLKEEGYDIQFYPFLNEETWKTLYSEGNQFKKAWGIIRSYFKRFSLLGKINKADHVFIHREAALIGPPLFEWIIAKVLRKDYIFDFDDAIWLPNYSESNARFHRLKNYRKVGKIIKWAKKVSAGNNYLKEYALKFNNNVVVIPTTLDVENVHNVKSTLDQNPPNIIWTGSHTTMQYLKDFVPILKELENSYSFTFTVISNQDPQLELSSFRFVKWSRENEIKVLASGTIGVMPMEQNEWSEGKCGFKGLQYMSLGIPTIMSPIGVNKEIIEHGVNGFLATTADDWKRHLSNLLENEPLRRTIGEKGYETIVKKYSVNSVKTNYLALFQ